MNELHSSNAYDFLKSLSNSCVDMVYTDPPFGTGDIQKTQRKFGSQIFEKLSYSDKHSNYLEFIVPHLHEIHRSLKETGTMYLHLDYRWVHYVKVECDNIFGHDNFLNEVIWSYNFGGRGKDRWPAKHDTILVYARKRGNHTFNWDEIDRIPYAAPELQYAGRSKEEAKKRIEMGQVPTDVWSMSIVGTASKERTGYPNQKPVKLIERAIRASSRPGEVVIDPFCGSGTTGIAAHNLGRLFKMSDSNPQAIDVIRRRLHEAKVNYELKQ